ncbi:MAG TPA: RtcB family protein [Chloroflexota bacterium]|nr:RtcB family protein [Chloroflexota bacterium]
MTPISGNDLKRAGWKPARSFGLAKQAAKVLSEETLEPADAIMTLLNACRDNPEAHLKDPRLEALACALVEEQEDAAESVAAELGPAKPYPIWGPELIDPGAIEQMDVAMRLPIAVAGALMPDAHIGYGIPIGGVLETRDAVIPYAVGSDIACRMRLTVFDVPASDLDRMPDRYQHALRDGTTFGAGRENNRKLDHDVLDRDWNATPQLRQLKDKARRQLGTSGSGNHFVEWGELAYVDDPSHPLLALLSHSGSRGVGFQIADRFSKLAEKRRKCDLPPEAIKLAWLDLDSADGQEYWVSMEMAGAFASANHEVIHQTVAGLATLKPKLVRQVTENHHNWAWRAEGPDGSARVTHRKGATPAGRGVMGVIPGSMAAPGYVVEGLGNKESLESASHGAGRAMGRREAERTITKTERNRILADRHITLIGGGIDESPQAYKPIDLVMAAQRDLVVVRAQFTPRIVRMAEGGPDI